MREIVPVGNRALAIHGDNDWSLQQLRETQQFGSRARALDTATRIDHRIPGVAQNLRRLLDQVRVATVPLTRRNRFAELDLPAGEERIDRKFDLHRARATRPQLPKCLGHRRGNASGATARAACFVTDRIIPIWFGISCNAPQMPSR